MAQPSTGKSQALGLMQRAVEKVEQYFEVTDNDSQQVNAPTMESLLDLLHRLPNLIGK